MKAIKKIETCHDQDNDIFSAYWGESYDYSEEMRSKQGQNFVIDYDKQGRLVGIEIFDWNGSKKKRKRKK